MFSLLSYRRGKWKANGNFVQDVRPPWRKGLCSVGRNWKGCGFTSLDNENPPSPLQLQEIKSSREIRGRIRQTFSLCSGPPIERQKCSRWPKHRQTRCGRDRVNHSELTLAWFSSAQRQVWFVSSSERETLGIDWIKSITKQHRIKEGTRAKVMWYKTITIRLLFSLEYKVQRRSIWSIKLSL